MSVGYETNSQRLLDKMRKGISADNYQPIIDNLYAAGINVRLSVMGGILDETREELRRSVQFLVENQNKLGIDVYQMLIAENYSYLTNNPTQFGIEGIAEDCLSTNDRLSFVSGRVGREIYYADGRSSATREAEFVEAIKEVKPSGNDDMPPLEIRGREHRDRLLQRQGNRDGDRLRLWPWIRPIEDPASPKRQLLVDLIWQRFYPLPEALLVRVSAQWIEASGGAAERAFLQKCYRAGLGKLAPQQGL